ncbi:MAG: homoserine dehydrogenase [Deltaproteobacteria bacterium]|jgi:homoserine dehydrogenase|nr:homoserine dehydrogenase [Deltaproteobacteria bacterium]
MSAPQELHLGLAGFGTVGSGVVRMLRENQQEILHRSGCRIVLRKIADLDVNKVRAADLPPDVALTADAFSLAEDPSLDAVVELMGGLGAAKELICRALRQGKQVITANKALLAQAGSELFPLAERHNVAIRYEASVAGGIPVVQTLRESLVGNRITSIIAILNGTSNYILSEMSTKGSSFEQALAEAQAAGYAEADPTLDIDGHDTAHKLILLIRLAWGMDYPYAHMPIAGIRSAQSIDIDFAREFNYRLRLLGLARMRDGRLEASVHPTLINRADLLSRVDGAHNAVRIEGNAVGSLFLHGLGAGSLPTASAVIADLVAAARDKSAGINGFTHQASVPPSFSPALEAEAPWYLRFTVRDCPGVLRDLAGALAQEGVSIAQAIQRNSTRIGVPLVFKTHIASARAISLAVERMQGNHSLLEPAVCYRILE